MTFGRGAWQIETNRTSFCHTERAAGPPGLAPARPGTGISMAYACDEGPRGLACSMQLLRCVAGQGSGPGSRETPRACPAGADRGPDSRLWAGHGGPASEWQHPLNAARQWDHPLARRVWCEVAHGRPMGPDLPRTATSSESGTEPVVRACVDLSRSRGATASTRIPSATLQSRPHPARRWRVRAPPPPHPVPAP